MKFRIVIQEDEDQMWVAECPALPGCISQGRTRAEALVNIQDAIRGYLASLQKHQEPIPPAMTEDVIFQSGTRMYDTPHYFRTKR